MVEAGARLLSFALVLALLGLSTLVAYLSFSHIGASDLSIWLAEDRYAWWAPALVILAFVAFSVVPVMLLVSLTGIAFGPVLGPLYAMAGCLASASTAFAIGRWIGPRHRERVGRGADEATDGIAASQRHARGLPDPQDPASRSCSSTSCSARQPSGIASS